MENDSAPFLCPPKYVSSPKWDEIEAGISDMSYVNGQIDALKKLIQYQVSGENPPDAILMKAIQHTATSKNHTIKKLLFLYYEVVNTRDKKGELKPEFLLICDALRNDLSHPNEYLRSAALRLVSKFNEPELIGGLVSTISESLTHRSAYVRRHAVVAIGRINQRWPYLAPDAPQDIAELLRNEEDSACRRVAFLILCDISRDLAAEFLDEVVDQSLLNFPESMQLTATALIRSLCSDKRKASYLPALLELLGSPSPGVQLSSALTLLDLTSSTTAARAGLTALIKIMMTVPNSSLQLSIADQIDRLLLTHTAVAQSLAVELLSALKQKAIRQKIILIVQKLITPDNAIDIANTLIRSLQAQAELRSNENEKNEAVAFIRLILSTMRIIAASQPLSIKTIYNGVNTMITDADPQIASDAMEIIRDAVHSSPELRETITLHLENLISSIRSPSVIRMALYLISLYTTNPDSVDALCDAFAEEEETQQGGGIDTTTVVLKDGTYVQKTHVEATDEYPSLASFLCKEPLLVSALSISLARICMRLPQANSSRAIDFIKSVIVKSKVDHELNRIGFALNALSNLDNDQARDVLFKYSEEAFNAFVDRQIHQISVKPAVSTIQTTSRVDQLVNFSSLLGKKFNPPTRTIARIEKKKGQLLQMSGTSDMIFCECRFITNKFDIVLDFRLLNQTAVVLSNIKLELNCVGKLELIDRAAPLTLKPDQAENLRLTIKVTSAEAGKIFGSISYDISNSSYYLPLALITVPSSDFMESSTISLTDFRKKWDVFEWEKRTAVHHAYESFNDFISKIADVSKLNAISDIDPELPFLTTNLYSKSFFGEEVLANVNVELKDGIITGFIRLRTNTLSMAQSFSQLFDNLE